MLLLLGVSADSLSPKTGSSALMTTAAAGQRSSAVEKIRLLIRFNVQVNFQSIPG